MTRAGAVLAAALPTMLATACLPRYHLTHGHDAFRDLRTTRMEANVLEGPRGARSWLELDGEVTRRRDVVACSLRVVYRDRHAPLNIPRGETLLVLADSQVLALGGRGSQGRRSGSWPATQEEAALYGITGDQLRRIAAASRVRVRLLGAREYVERSFSARNLERLRAFVRLALPDSGNVRAAEPAPAGARPPKPAKPIGAASADERRPPAPPHPVSPSPPPSSPFG